MKRSCTTYKYGKIWSRNDYVQHIDLDNVYRARGKNVETNTFLICLISPVLHKLVCGQFKERASRQLELPETDAAAFQMMIDLACGREINDCIEISTLIKIAELADQFGMDEVVSMLDDVISELINAENCTEVLGKGAIGLQKVSHLGREVALLHFEQMIKSEGLSKLSPTELISLLEDDRLKSLSEEFVFESVLPLIRGCNCNTIRRQILECIRFPLMSKEYLAGVLSSNLTNLEDTKLYVLEAYQMKQPPEDCIDDYVFRYLGAKSFSPRKYTVVQWNLFESGGEKRLGGNFMETLCIAECNGRMCSGDLDGSIRIWNKKNFQLESTFYLNLVNNAHFLEDEEVEFSPWCDCMTSLDQQLITGHEGGRIAVWNLCSEHCKCILEGHTSHVRALVVSGNRLISGSDDWTIKVWAIDLLLTWPCERTMQGHRDSVKCLVGFGSCVISGSSDSSIKVWKVICGTCSQTLRGHRGRVVALLVHDSKLFSSATDRTLRIWCVKTWEVQCIVDTNINLWQHIQSLTVVGNKLVTGSASALHLTEQQRNDNECEVKVWDLETLKCEHTFKQPGGQDVLAVVGTGGQVWAAVGREIAVWSLNK
jgi:hypothetical protein